MIITDEQFKKIESLLNKVMKERDDAIDKNSEIVKKLIKKNIVIDDQKKEIESLKKIIKTMENSEFANKVVLRETLSSIEELNAKIECYGIGKEKNAVAELIERFDERV